MLLGRLRIRCGYRETCPLAYEPTLGSVREVAYPQGAASNRVCDRVEVPTANGRKAFALPERGSWNCFPEQESDRARRECPTGDSSQTQKTRCTTACCWAMETSTTEVKAVKGLTRPCADLPVTNPRGPSPGQTELALKLAYFNT